MSRRKYFYLFLFVFFLSCPAQQPGTAVSQPLSEVDKLREALRVAEAEHPGNTPEVAKAINELLVEIYNEGQPSAADLELALRGLKVSATAAGENSELFVNTLSDTAMVYAALSRPAEGRTYAERALSIARQQFPNSDAFIDSAIAAGHLCDILGDFQCAITTEQEAIAVERKVQGHEWQLVETLNLLSNVQERSGNRTAAGASLEEAVQLARRVHPDDPEIAILEANLGVLYMRNQQFEQSLQHLQQSIADLTRSYGPGNRQIPRVLITLGELNTRRGAFAEAWKCYEEALANPHVTADELARERAAFSRSLASGGDLKRAIEQGLIAERIGRETFQLQARILPESQALTYEKQRPRGLGAVLSVLARHPELSPENVYQEVVRSRALVADEMASRQKNLNSANDPKISELLQELSAARGDLLKAVSAPPESPGAQDAIASAQKKVDTIERQLAELSAFISSNERIRAVELTELSRNLPPNSVLVSYVRYKNVPVEKIDAALTSRESYIAFVLHADKGQISVFDLGAAGDIDDQVSKLRKNVDEEINSGGFDEARIERIYRETGETLRGRIWDPLKGELKGVEKIFIVPDGTLNMVPFAALPEGKGYLVEQKFVIHILSSERDLLPIEAGPTKAGLLAVGSPAYELEVTSKTPSVLRDAGPPCEVIGKQSFALLPQSGPEVTGIDQAWRRWHADEPTTLLIGAEATRARFVEESGRNRILHVATHAFVVGDQCGDANPLLHSGLVFAGANRNLEDAILTAEQIASLDLRGVDIAVLSACNTGSGELRDGEGVLGFQRAFRIAGARSVVMTLWSVDDKIISSYMRQLYAQLLSSHDSTADAVWSTSRKLLIERRLAGMSTHPWYWAGVISSGGSI
jgi:CHAT domain-containing protein